MAGALLLAPGPAACGVCFHWPTSAKLGCSVRRLQRQTQLPDCKETLKAMKELLIGQVESCWLLPLLQTAYTIKPWMLWCDSHGVAVCAPYDD